MNTPLVRPADDDPYGNPMPAGGTLSGTVPMKTILRDGETMYRMRRIVQFSAVGRGIVEQLVVLCDDGSLWLAAPIGHPLSPTKWEQIPGPPPWSDAPLAEGGKVAAAPEQGQRDDGLTVHPASSSQLPNGEV